MTQPDFQFDLGDKVKDRISGLIGIVMSRSEHLTGCNRYWASPQEVKDGKPAEGAWFDEDVLELISAEEVKRRRYKVHDGDARPVRKAGGPSDQPSPSGSFGRP